MNPNETPMSENVWPARREQLERLYGVSKANLDAIEDIILQARTLARAEFKEEVRGMVEEEEAFFDHEATIHDRAHQRILSALDKME